MCVVHLLFGINVFDKFKYLTANINLFSIFTYTRFGLALRLRLK